MAITLINIPNELNTSKNPIAYTLQTDESEIAFAAKLFVETVFGSDIPTGRSLNYDLQRKRAFARLSYILEDKQGKSEYFSLTVLTSLRVLKLNYTGKT